MTLEPGSGPFGAFDHIGIAVRDLEDAAVTITRMLGGTVSSRGEDEQLAIDWLFIEAPLTPMIELVAPRGTTGAIARFIKDRGPGIHHLSFKTPDLNDSLRHAAEQDLTSIGLDRRHGGYEEFFIHPRMTGGALFHCFRALDDHH